MVLTVASHRMHHYRLTDITNKSALASDLDKHHQVARKSPALKHDGLIVPKQQDVTDILTALLSLQNWAELNDLNPTKTTRYSW